MRRVGLKMLECGSCKQLEAMTMVGAPWRVATFPSLVGLLRHPTEGIVLFDTGYAPAFLEATAALPERIYRWTTPVTLKTGESAVERLAALGIAPSDVGHVVVSHFHGDHVAGLRDFPGARIHCSKAGLDDLTSRGRIDRVRHGLLDALLPEDMPDACFFEDDRTTSLPSAFSPFEQGADVLGDGSLVAVPLPGHCPGHWGLALKLDDDRHVLLVADSAWSIEAIERDAPPPAFTARLLGDQASQRDTLSTLHGMTGREDLAMLPSHCRTASLRAGLIA
jgi:glyoxylase-like metal-dependent hydrolase (beta-lactamase superfamily II)